MTADEVKRLHSEMNRAMRKLRKIVDLIERGDSKDLDDAYLLSIDCKKIIGEYATI